jgi:hypothetical protein
VDMSGRLPGMDEKILLAAVNGWPRASGVSLFAGGC